MKTIVIIAFGLLVGISNIEAQQIKTSNQVNKEAIANLTESQKLMLEKQRELIKKNRAIFKASLSEKQLAILENAKLTKREKQKALVASFTTAQKKLLHEQRMNVLAIKQQFRNMLTDEQLQQIRMRLRSFKNIQDGKELMDKVRDRRHRQHD
jgi:predicted O-linked N-acetylglucosamine transferase (SPINDLY family)